MKAYISHFGKSKIILEEYNFGVYVIYFVDHDSTNSTRDDLYDNLEDAKKFCKEDYGVNVGDWELVFDHKPLMVTE